MGNAGPLGNMPATPWWNQDRGRTAGQRAPAPTFAVTDKVIVRSKFSANPGVLVSGRRPERPGG